MKKTIIMIALLVLGVSARAQSVDITARASAGVDYKIMKGLHVTAEEEIRAASNFEALGSLRTTVGITYKPVKYLKVGAGYTLINPWSTSEAAFKPVRHRFFADVTGYLPLGDFQLSLKERFQVTHRTGEFNVYQNTPTGMALKTRLALKYKGWKRWEPGISVEMRTLLNEPWGYTTGSQQTNSSGKKYYAYTHTGYTHVYNDRYRVNLSCEIKLNKHHSLTPYLMAQFYSQYEIDTNSEGERLFSAAYNNYLRFTPGINYVFSF